MAWHLIDYKGKLAITLGWSPDEIPTESRPIWYSPDNNWDEHYYSQFTDVKLITNNYFQCWSNLSNTSKPLYTDGWLFVNETRDIKKPGRGGKDWQWEWSSYQRRWRKSYT